jgi:ABC-type dipeptide/oligopeptide/nickel transport system permease component
LSAVHRTAVVFVTGLAVAYLLGSWLGRAAAWRGAGLLSDMTTLTAITFYAFFPPALVFVLRTLLAQRLQWLPDDLTLFTYKYEKEFTIPLEVVIQRMALCLPIALSLVLLGNLLIRRFARQGTPAGLSLIIFLAAWAGSWFILGIGPMALQAIQLAAIPTIAFVLLSTGEMMVIARTCMTETLDEQYIQTAQAKGLKPSQIRDRHAGRNALLPLMSRLVISLPYLLGGLAIIESAVGWPGMGTAIFFAAQYQDVPVVLGYLLLIGVMVLVSQLTLEVLYVYLDPRIRLPAREPR